MKCGRARPSTESVFRTPPVRLFLPAKWKCRHTRSLTDPVFNTVRPLSLCACPCACLPCLCVFCLSPSHYCQDFLTCAFLITSRDKFLTRSQFSQLCAAMGDGLDEVGGGCVGGGGAGELAYAFGGRGAWIWRWVRLCWGWGVGMGWACSAELLVWHAGGGALCFMMGGRLDEVGGAGVGRGEGWLVSACARGRGEGVLGSNLLGLSHADAQR